VFHDSWIVFVCMFMCECIYLSSVGCFRFVGYDACFILIVCMYLSFNHGIIHEKINKSMTKIIIIIIS